MKIANLKPFFLWKSEVFFFFFPVVWIDVSHFFTLSVWWEMYNLHFKDSHQISVCFAAAGKSYNCIIKVKRFPYI